MKQMQLLYLVLLALLLFSCSTPKETTKIDTETIDVVKKFVNEVNLEIEKNVSWVNLMPGSEPKFHISGKLSLLNGDDYENETTQLKYIKVYQSGEELYYIMPKVIEELDGTVKKLTFSTIKGLNISKTLDTKSPVVFEFLFYDGKDELKYRENNVIVEEVH
jgi:hypothetical protein